MSGAYRVTFVMFVVIFKLWSTASSVMEGRGKSKVGQLPAEYEETIATTLYCE